MYMEYGVEMKILGRTDCCNRFFWSPFFAMHFRDWHDGGLEEWNHNSTYALGVEFSRLRGIGRKLRLLMEYHEGYSVEGQFGRMPTDYLSLKIAYGY